MYLTLCNKTISKELDDSSDKEIDSGEASEGGNSLGTELTPLESENIIPYLTCDKVSCSGSDNSYLTVTK